MTNPLSDIRRLLPMLDTAFQAEQVKMAKILARIRDLKQQLVSLETPETFDPLTMASRGGADILWETWVQERKTLINQEIVLAARDREAVRGAVIAALSKLEAAKQMEARATLNARQTAARRSTW